MRIPTAVSPQYECISLRDPHRNAAPKMYQLYAFRENYLFIVFIPSVILIRHF